MRRAGGGRMEGGRSGDRRVRWSGGYSGGGEAYWSGEREGGKGLAGAE